MVLPAGAARGGGFRYLRMCLQTQRPLCFRNRESSVLRYITTDIVGLVHKVVDEVNLLALFFYPRGLVFTSFVIAGGEKDWSTPAL